MVIMDIYFRFLNNSFLFSLGDMVIMDMPVRLLTLNQQIRRHAILAYRRQMKGATTQDTPAERNKKYCKNWQAKQKEK